MTSFSFGGYINTIQCSTIYIQYNKNTSYINLSLRNYIKSILSELNKNKNNVYINPYEYIYNTFDANTPSVCTLSGHSASFFIYIELLNHYHFHFTDKVRSLHISEPESSKAFKHYRNNNADVIYNLSVTKMSVKRIYTIYNKHAHSLDFITGNLDYIEENNMNSLIYEMMLAICLQKQGGHLILKLSDTFTELSIEVLYILNFLYKDVYLMKPVSCNANNNTKYLVCVKFKMVSNLNDIIHHLLKHLDFSRKICRLLNNDVPSIFIDKVIELNLIFGQKYIEQIKNIINYRPNELHLDTIKKTHLSKCMKWCKKNNLPIN